MPAGAECCRRKEVTRLRDGCGAGCGAAPVRRRDGRGAHRGGRPGRPYGRQLVQGGYHGGDSTGLGGVFQFRLSLDVAFRFDNGHRLGVRGAHISNAGVNEQNPGEDELFLTYSVPLGPYL